MQRRAWVLGLAALACPRIVRAEEGVRRLAVQFVHTGKWFRGPFKSDDAFDPAAVADFSAVMADHRTGQSRAFDPALLDLLWRLTTTVRVSEVSCLSGYRTPATNALVGGAPDSQHLSARALDLWMPGRKLGEAMDRAVAMKAGGVGLYPTWLHLDTGEVRVWDRRRGGTGPNGEREIEASPWSLSRVAVRMTPRSFFTGALARSGERLDGPARGATRDIPALRGSGQFLLRAPRPRR
ncbi:DUF882 domain-containing protein [Sabulicella glaciei]|uniref:Murein endopeptidase K n=1 Tax=Sabulicella glaciei TaxID=2984948 RepID=A0ABT3P1S4_9PROT|nr:DUF882 domain-containing protein [Roseococcus sp. MDT2-1-1]MCW8088346.1 DUF882 domain-containing protein [Roseococcus sp. MDT2-1-1]